MSIIFSDEILSEMIRISEQEKPVYDEPGLQIDESQFSSLPEIRDEAISLASMPMIQGIVVSAEGEGLNKDILKEKKKATDFDDIIEQAHPDTALMADGPEGTGVVEDLNEQRRKMLDVVYRVPTGFHFNTMAQLIDGLTKVAQALESKGDLDAAKKVDNTLASIVSELKKKVASPLGLPAPLGLPGGTQVSPIKPPPMGLPGSSAPALPAASKPPKTPMWKALKFRSPEEFAKAHPGEVQTRVKSLKQHKDPLHTRWQGKPPSGEIPKSIDKKMPLDQNPSKPALPGAPAPGKPVPLPGSNTVQISDKPHPHRTFMGDTSPKAPKGPSGKAVSLLGGLGRSLKGKGKIGLILTILGAGAAALYKLWESQSSEWDDNIVVAKEEASTSMDPDVLSTVDALESQGERIKELLLAANGSEELSPEALEEIGILVDLSNDLLFKSHDASLGLQRAAKNLHRIALNFDKQGKQYVDKLLQRQGIEAEVDSNRIASMQRWLKQNTDPELEITGEPNNTLRQHLELFVSNMKKRFGAGFKPRNLNTDVLLNHGSYELLDDLYRVWKYPHQAIGETEE